MLLFIVPKCQVRVTVTKIVTALVYHNFERLKISNICEIHVKMKSAEKFLGDFHCLGQTKHMRRMFLRYVDDDFGSL